MPAPAVPTLGQHIVIGVGELAVSAEANALISTYALGSCIGLVAYDPGLRAGGMLHLMLPESRISPAKAAAQPGMFADTGLPLFFRLLEGLRVERSRLQLVIAGGANVLKGRDPFRIGEMNTKAVLGYLQKHGYPVIHREIGSTINRTLHLELATGWVTLKMPERQDRVRLQ